MKDEPEAGFLTLEAIVALVVATLVLVAYYQSVTVALSGASRARLSESALAVGQSELSTPQSTAGGRSRSGKLSFGATWSLKTSPVDRNFTAGSLTSQAHWVTYIARDRAGRIILELKTVKFIPSDAR